MDIKRGDIFYIEQFQTNGSEQRPGRPAIVVSNDRCNKTSDVIEVVWLTTQPKKDLPTHVSIRSSARESVALCEQITSISVDRVGNYYGSISKSEMNNIDIALLISLDLQTGTAKERIVEVEKEVIVKSDEDTETLKAQLAEAKNDLVILNAEHKMLKDLYNSLISQMILKQAT